MSATGDISVSLPPKKDEDGACISVDPISHLVRVDGIPMFKAIDRKDGIYLQFKDSDKTRSKYRGTQLIEIPLDVLITKLKTELS